MKFVAWLALFTGGAWSEPATGFEVASVKVSAPFTQGGRVVRGCGEPDPAMVRCAGVSLRMLVMRAYGMRGYQVVAPGLNSESYDILAKVPDGAPASQTPAMLQALLADRFAMTIHKETRILPVYELTLAKGGPKLKEAEVDNLPPMPQPGSARPEYFRAPGGGPLPLSSVPAGVNMEIVKVGSRTIRGNLTVAQLVSSLTVSLDRPVLDNTGLKGTYEIELSYAVDENDGANAPITTLFQALQQTLGLKLEAKKAPVEMIVVDSANKVPTEN